MGSATIKNVLDLLRSEKVKDRQEGISSLQTVFAHESTILKVDEKGDGKAWLVIYQALFNAVLKEKDAYAKKGDASSAVVKRRLGDAASAVRWLIEHSVQRMNSKVVKAVLAHLTKFIINRGELFTPVALQYAKAIRCILSYAPHLEHLVETTWITLLEMSLNVILGDRVRRNLNEMEDTFAEEREDSLLAGSEVDESGEDGTPSTLGPSSSRKRKLPPATQTRQTPFSGSPAPTSHPVTQEQVEFMSLLVVLLQSSSAPLLSPQHPYLPVALFNRLSRILQKYPGDSSLHHDYLLALSAALSHVALNDSATVIKFAHDAWEGLLSMWGTKNQRTKQDLVVVLQTLFPYYTAEPVDPTVFANVDYANGVAKLWHLLSSEAESRWGVDGLSLDRLRLEARQLGVDGDSPQPFVGSTFRHGWQFDSSQALAWTILELQADCTAKLYRLTESVHSMEPSNSRGAGKRVKLESPVKSLLDLVNHSSVSGIRSYHLQSLLFFIDKHWAILHEELQQQVISVLLQFVSFEGGSVQSWTFLCLAAIAHSIGASLNSSSAPGSRPEPSSTTTWDAIYAHAMRRVTVASVSRAACHTASVFLLHSKELLTSQRLIAEIETLGKDLDVQGPVFPYDSVCAFLDLALRIASQDVRLYRMQLEEKVLSWFVDTWRVGSAPKTRLPAHTVADLLMLLEGVCSFSTRSHLICGMPLSDSSIVRATNDHCYTAVIRDFSIQARLPPWRQRQATTDPDTSSGQNSEEQSVALDDLAPPRSRERRISAFLLKAMEELCAVWESSKEASGFITAERVRSCLDVSFLALSYEAILVVNGIQPTRRVVQAACRLIQTVLPQLSEKRWTSEERSLMLGSLHPLVSALQDPAQEPWETLTSPGSYTGVRRQILSALNTGAGRHDHYLSVRRQVQRTIFRSAEVQDTFTNFLVTLKSTLRLASGASTSPGSDSQAMDIDIEDDFGELRTVQDAGTTTESLRNGAAVMDAHGMEICMTALAVIPVLQSTSGLPTRDKDLAKLVLNSDESRFLDVAQVYFTIVKTGMLSISASTLEQFLERFGDLWPQYGYARNDHLQCLSLHFLHSTMACWLDRATPNNICDAVRELWSRLAAKLLSGKLTSWKSRDVVVRLLDANLAQDPREQFEKMMTRILCLADTMIVSSAVRRGAYWHLLEGYLYAPKYASHMEAALVGVADRLGLSGPADFFEHYASQMASSICKGGKDFLSFPPRVLGYQERRQCAEVAFHSFAPANLLNEEYKHGYQLFQNHCGAVHKTLVDGLQECFPETVGYQIVISIGAALDEERDLPEDLATQLQYTMRDLGQQIFDLCLRRTTDVVVATIVRSLADQDVSSDGPVHAGLRMAGYDKDSDRVLEHLFHYRRHDEFQFHQPNFPFYSTEIVLKALQWFTAWVPEAQSPAITYHVLHQLFAIMERCPFINEQMRLLNGICVWVATRRQHFEDSTLLRTLMNMASTILSQADMARAAQSILDWCFNVYRRSTERSYHLSDLLVQIGSIAQDYQRAPHDTSSVALANDLVGWIESVMQNLAQRDALRPQIIRALASWPFDTSPALVELRDSLNVQEISQILSDPPVTAHKFRLARRIRDLTIGQERFAEHLVDSSFWTLKQCIPSSDKLHDDDIDAFVALLFHNGGTIRSPEHASAEMAIQTIRQRHRQMTSSLERSGTQDAAQRAIIISLLEMLDASSAAQINIAYRTLRSVMSVCSLDSSALRTWCREYAGDLSHLQAHPVPVVEKDFGSLPQLLASTHLQQASRDFSEWITNLSMSLCGALAIRDRFYASLSLILQSNATFAENIMPVLVHAVLSSERSARNSDGGQILRLALSDHFDAVLNYEDVDVRCLRAIIDTVLHLRHFHPPDVRDALAYDVWLRNDFRLLSKKSVRCGAYTTALLFLELAAENESEDASDASAAEDTLFDIYSRIDEPDGFYGIRSSNLSNFLIKRLHHEKQWDTAFRYHGAALTARPSDSIHGQGVVQSLHAFGFDRLAMTALGSVTSQSHENNDSQSAMMYELGWRTGTWDLPECRAGQYPGASLYVSLRAFYRERDPNRVDTVVRQSLFQELAQLHYQGNENLTTIRHTTQTLMCLHQIRWWKHEGLMQLSRSRNGQPYNHVWNAFDQTAKIENFDDMESLMATRISLIRARRQKEERDKIGDLLSPLGRSLMELERGCLLRLSQAARDAQRPQAALNAITQAQVLGGEGVPEVTQEFANVLWLMKEPRLAASLLKDTLSTMTTEAQKGPEEDKFRVASLLARLGTWSAQASLDKPDQIIEQYFDPAIQLLSDVTVASNVADRAAVFHQYAIFADHQYHSVINSPDALRWRIYMDRKTEEIRLRQEKMQKVPVNTQERHELERALKKAEKELRHDQARFKEHKNARDRFLGLAMTTYSECLAHSDAYDSESIIRLCSLWLANFDRTDTDVSFEAALTRVASHKFVFLAHQLAARLSKSTSPRATTSNQALLHSLLSRMCREHPFHSLYQVLCLISDQSSAGVASGRRQSGRLETVSSQAERAAAAGAIIDQLRTDAQVQGRLSDVEQLFRASLQWATYKVKKDAKGNLPIPDGFPIKRIRDLRVPVMTSHTPVDPSCQYSDCVWISHFESTFSTSGGLNLPKICVCVGVDGQKYKQLYKGGDDLRQDAVMEQVFELVNIILRRDRETRRRDLAVRGYRIIPLASQAGILEFVQDTTPLATWLPDAHSRYRPGDIRSHDVMRQLKEKQHECQNDRSQMLEFLVKLRRRFRPVMRHYFTERHKEPLAWFTMRLKYSRSVATNAIVGHILGLGDRHCSNILMDNATGEMVHIDLGIAFDQGKMLPIPERVPFRLTADVVDGLGTSGTQGVFQRCAEETLRVLRDESEVVLTVLEVFKYDPLHSWSVIRVASEVKMKRVQGSGNDATFTGEAVRWMIGIDMASGSADEAADRALTAVRRKLDKTLSIEYTVNELVTEATDPGNLAQMFCGTFRRRARKYVHSVLHHRLESSPLKFTSYQPSGSTFSPLRLMDIL
ncbi:uncharacterized protein B0H18DRAFT_884948 [Fomitopsis serialis]|uniref:uncharacterized protein n=1 Tax=Fomitopsis serialis TaxID=139415 RepID=UPI002008BDE3|nr:uncharacterized protein B0H18DRAFT_884948 [Neoantrodia serialis]KAH9916328.1 hypothetical protein B0H18DRAFT_884948 [Neoantrodia serialis]